MIVVKAYDAAELAVMVTEKLESGYVLHGQVNAIFKGSDVYHQGSKTVNRYEYIQFMLER